MWVKVKDKMAKNNEIGQQGELIAAKYLEKKGFFVVNRNYRRKWGELDIVAERQGRIHFVEVKTVSRRSYGGNFEQEINNYRPEDNVHREKIKRLSRIIQTYMIEKYHKSEPEWQFDILCVFLDMEKRVAKVRVLENIIL